MSNERERLLTMLRENKISEEEYQLISGTLKKESTRFNRVFSFLMNPFQKIAGVKALLGGMVIFLAMASLGVKARLYFPGVLSCLNADVVKSASLHPTFYVLMYQLLVGWAVMVALFMACTLAFRQKGTRIIDFLGTIALARFPSLIMTVFLLAIRIVNPSVMDIDLSKGLPIHTPIMMAIFFEIPIVLLFMWQTATYFYALKESSGLVGKNLWISFMGSMVLGEVIAGSLATMIA